MPENPVEPTASPTLELVYDQLDRGIDAAQREDLDTALEALSEAEALAEKLGAMDLVATAHINAGYAHWVAGDIETARQFYAEGAELARDNDDSERLQSALLNFAAASRQVARWDEAVIALEEYLTLGVTDPADLATAHIDCGLSMIEAGDYLNATSHLEKAESIATEADLTDLAITARIDQGVAKERGGDRDSSITLYQDAAEMARAAGNDELLVAAVVSEAYAHRPIDPTAADPLFSQAEDLYRSLGTRAQLADTLYWHAATLKDAGMRDRALAMWREEEVIRRELEQHVDLGDCLLGQASVLRDREEWLALETAYAQAEDAYERGGSNTGLAETRLLQSRLLRIQGRIDEAIERSQEALNSALGTERLATECRVRGLRAMLLAEKGDTAGALEELNSAESTSIDKGMTEQATWAIARRAYVLAHMGEAPEEIVLQLKTAHQYGADNDRARLGKRAALRMISEIKANCDQKYVEPLDALKAELRAASDAAAQADAAAEAAEATSPEPEVDSATSLEVARENETE